MNDKERLEEIKEYTHSIPIPILSDFQWLIKQAERVEELEDNALDFIEYSNDKTIEVIDLKKENQRYKQALGRIEENSNDKVAVFIASKALQNK